MKGMYGNNNYTQWLQDIYNAMEESESFSLVEHNMGKRQKNSKKTHKCQMHHISEAIEWYIKEENLLPNYLLPTLFSLASLFWTCRRHH